MAKFCKIYDFCKIFAEISLKLLIFKPIFCENFEIAAVQKDANFVELEKCCRTHTFLQNFVLIQQRTSPPKIYKILLIFPILLTLTPNPPTKTRTPTYYAAADRAFFEKGTDAPGPRRCPGRGAGPGTGGPPTGTNGGRPGPVG